MTLGARLRQLRVQSGAAIPQAAAPGEAAVSVPARAPHTGFRERLERLSGARVGEGGGLERLLRLTGAAVVADGLVRVATDFPLPLRHGGIAIGLRGAGTIQLPVAPHRAVTAAVGDLLFLDTETTGLAGGTGTAAFLLGLGRLDSSGIRLEQYLVTRFAGERRMLELLGDNLRSAACLVTYNGKSYDLPLLRGRHALQRFGAPFPDVPHCDLLHATRRHLRRGWPDCRLLTAEQQALGFHRPDDLPGAAVPAAWRRWLTVQDTAAVPRILAHNRDDLVSMIALAQLLVQGEPRGAPLFSREGAAQDTGSELPAAGRPHPARAAVSG